MEKKIFIALVILLGGCLMYWSIVVSTHTEQLITGNDFTNRSSATMIDAMLFELRNNKKAADSCDKLAIGYKAIGKHYYQKADETILLIPKFLRP